MAFYIYIVASKKNGTLYVGMTDDLVKRVWQHRNELNEGFTKRYGLKILVWFEVHESRESAFTRERQIKKWNRGWKLELFEKQNSSWRDLLKKSVCSQSAGFPAYAGMSGCGQLATKKGLKPSRRCLQLGRAGVTRRAEACS